MFFIKPLIKFKLLLKSYSVKKISSWLQKIMKTLNIIQNFIMLKNKKIEINQ